MLYSSMQCFLRGTLKDIQAQVWAAKLTCTALIFAGWILNKEQNFIDSNLYKAPRRGYLFPIWG